MRIKKGDKVVIITGKDKGKSGKVLRVFPLENKIVVEGVHVVKKHQRATRQRQHGQIVDKTLPIDASNASLADPKSGKPTRVRIERKDGKRLRVAVKSGIQVK